eukprot:1232051-Alexandrium_andersonii.AAC.1
MPARTARARSTVAPHAGQKTGSSPGATEGPPSCVSQAAHNGLSGRMMRMSTSADPRACSRRSGSSM